MDFHVNRLKYLASLSAPLGLGYGWGMRLRRWAYGKEYLASWKPPAPCVSVGNIAVGGGGKTPLCQWLLQWAVTRNLRPCLLSRGYGASPPRVPLLVTPETSWRHCGDEPLLLSRAVPSAPVVVDPRRVRGAKWALARLQPDLFILDDGMQHLALQRHVNIVLLRPDDFGRAWGRVLPWGLWREPAAALNSADAFCVKCPPCCFDELRDMIRNRLGTIGRPVFNVWLRPQALLRASTGQSVAPADLRTYLSMSAVADNNQVRDSIETYMGRPASAHLGFRDHRAFTERDVRYIAAEKQRCGAEAVICTAKDAVKLTAFNLPYLHVLHVALESGEGLFTTRNFFQWWQERWNGLAAAPKDERR